MLNGLCFGSSQLRLHTRSRAKFCPESPLAHSCSRVIPMFSIQNAIGADLPYSLTRVTRLLITSTPHTWEMRYAPQICRLFPLISESTWAECCNTMGSLCPEKSRTRIQRLYCTSCCKVDLAIAQNVILNRLLSHRRNLSITRHSAAWAGALSGILAGC